MDTALAVGRYGIDEWLASGAMGVVFRGHDPVLDRAVAIKVLRRELAKGSAAEEWRDRFRHRARAAGRLFHPNIPTVLDFAEDHEVPFIALEYVEGTRLDRLLGTAGRFAPQRAVRLILQVLDALKHAHENGVVHLDLKPSIILVIANDRVKVADFGATLTNAAASMATLGELSEATTPCMAPEQLARGAVDHRADFFAAAAVLFEMLTCAKPFQGANTEEIIVQMAAKRPEDISALNPDVPSALRSIIERALAYDPAERFATAGEFARALGEAVPLPDSRETEPRSLPAAGSSALMGSWNPETLREIEADLARHIGPVAAVAVRRAAKRTHDLGALYEELAAHIEVGRERDEFLRSGLRLAEISNPTAPLHSPDGPRGRASQANEPAGPPDPAILEAIEVRLAQYVGPIARILLKQQLQDYRSMPELYRNLAAYISNESSRAAFLNSQRI